MEYIYPGMIEYRKLERNGKCCLCGTSIEAHQEEVTIIHTVTNKKPVLNICRTCAYKIFYAPALVTKDSNIVR